MNGNDLKGAFDALAFFAWAGVVAIVVLLLGALGTGVYFLARWLTS